MDTVLCIPSSLHFGVRNERAMLIAKITSQQGRVYSLCESSRIAVEATIVGAQTARIGPIRAFQHEQILYGLDSVTKQGGSEAC